LGGGVVVGANDGVARPARGELAGEPGVAGIACLKEVARNGDDVCGHGGDCPGFAGIDGDCGKGTRDECEAPRTKFDEMVGKQIAASEIVDADEVKIAAPRETLKRFTSWASVGMRCGWSCCPARISVSNSLEICWCLDG
jgi:hypothetical protein